MDRPNFYSMMPVYNSILKQNFINIKNPIIDLYYEILLTCNKDTQLCRRIISKIGVKNV